jgi:AcrR family transcriptional regulator
MASRVKRSEETRAQITAAAARALAERGYGGVRVQDIARRAGVTTGAIYKHFPGGRAEVIAAAVEAEVASVVEEGPDEGGVGDWLAELAAQLLADPNRSGVALEIEALAAARREPDLAALMRGRPTRARAGLVESLAAARARGEIDSEMDPEAFGYLAHALLLGMALLYGATEQRPSTDAWQRLIRRFLAGPVTAPPPGGSSST